MTLPPDISCLSSSEKDTLIGVLMARLDALAARVSALEAENAALKAENATLREKLKLPPKTPDNSSKPPSQGQKPNGETKAKPPPPCSTALPHHYHILETGNDSFRFKDSNAKPRKEKSAP